jgi:RNA recognition motif-containing protein
VSWAYKRNKQEIKEHKLIAQSNNNHELPQGAELHFSFVSKQTDFLVTEATLRAIFEEFGPIQHICIKKTAFNERGGQNGYGFVHYPLTPEGINAAVKASSMVRQVVLDRVIYDCMMTHAFQKYLSQINSNISSPSALSLDASPSQPPLLLLSSSHHHQQQPYHNAAAAQNQKMMDAFFLPSASMMQSNANPRSSMSRSSSFSSLSSAQSTSSSLWNGISEASFTSPELNNCSSSVLPPGLLTSNHSSSLVFPGFSSAFY